ncbi:hypothetical protein ABKV19_014446 [Rosa sericea]
MSSNASSTLHLNRTPILDRRFQLRGLRTLFIIPHSLHSIRIESRKLQHDVVATKADVLFKSPTTSRTSGTDKNNNSLNLSETTRNTNNNMGSEGCAAASDSRKPRFLCLHGFRTSGLILKTQLGKWPESVLKNFDLDFLDGPFPAQGKSEVEGIFDPPYHEWFQFNKEFSEYTNFDECLEFIEDYMIKNGPFDGLLGFSQGAILSAALPGLQAKGLALTKVPKIKFLIIIGGAKFKSPTVAENAYSSPIQIPSLHFLGETDFLKPYGLELLENCVDPTVIHHPKGHTIPRLDEKGLETIMSFIETIQKRLDEKEEQQ